jgi:hypothetical protein
LNVSLALIVRGEKPHLSPCPAAVFGKKAGAIYNSRAGERVFGAARNPNTRPSEIPGRPFLEGFRAFPPPTSRRRDAAKALFCRSRGNCDDVAHLCSKAD